MQPPYCMAAKQIFQQKDDGYFDSVTENGQQLLIQIFHHHTPPSKQTGHSYQHKQYTIKSLLF